MQCNLSSAVNLSSLCLLSPLERTRFCDSLEPSEDYRLEWLFCKSNHSENLCFPFDQSVGYATGVWSLVNAFFGESIKPLNIKTILYDFYSIKQISLVITTTFTLQLH